MARIVFSQKGYIGRVENWPEVTKMNNMVGTHSNISSWKLQNILTKTVAILEFEAGPGVIIRLCSDQGT